METQTTQIAVAHRPERTERVFRRTATWRILHWAQFLAIVAATVTGLYIADPYYAAGTPNLMAWNRAIHLYAAIVLDLVVIAFAYLYFFSRAERSAEQLRPSRSNLQRFQEAFLNFVLLNRRKRFDSSIADPLNAVWFALLHVFVVIQLFTGLQLYVQHFTAGTSVIGSWWPWVMHATTDWTRTVFGGVMGVRAAHHITMYFILAWVLCHIYYEVWRTIVWKEGDIGIAFGGYKFRRRSPATDATPEPGP